MGEWPDTPAGRALRVLEGYYERPAPPPAATPFEMVLWEIVAYLAGDARRAAAFAALRERVGLRPAEILAAPVALLGEITRMGGPIAAESRAVRLQLAARLVLEEWGGELGALPAEPPQKLKRRLMRFPMIGEPGAEKILLFSGALAVLALESNGMRALVRIGIGEDRKSYASTYRCVREATLEQLPADHALLSAAHLILRRHGQELCRVSEPACAVCPLRRDCRYAALRAGSG